MCDTLEMPHTHDLGNGVVMTSYIVDHGWLAVSTISSPGTTELHVNRSAYMDDTSRSYRPVLELIEKLGAELINREIFHDADWIHRKCEALTFSVPS